MKSRQKKDVKKLAVRVVSMALAILMVLSVVLATIWQW